MSDNRIGKAVLSSLLLVPALAALAGCSALVKEVFKAPKVRVTDVALASSPFENPQGPLDLTLSLSVDNPNGYDLNVADIAYSAVIGRETVAQGEHGEKLRIAASSVTVVKVPLRLRPDSFKAALRQVLAARALPYEFNGSIGLRAPVAGLVRIPFSKTGSLDPAELLRKRGLGLN